MALTIRGSALLEDGEDDGTVEAYNDGEGRQVEHHQAEQVVGHLVLHTREEVEGDALDVEREHGVPLHVEDAHLGGENGNLIARVIVLCKIAQIIDNLSNILALN